MHNKNKHHRSHRREREPRAHLGPARGLLARAVDRVRAFFGDRDAIRRLHADDQRRHRDIRQHARAERAERAAFERLRREVDLRRRRDRLYRGEYPLNFLPSPQVWPWQFMGRSAPWPPAPESYYSQFAAPSISGRPYGRKQRGKHTGRGPRNYSRPDARITEDINEALTYSPQIDASDIEIRVNQGAVTVMGTVDDRYIKRLVEDLIEDVSGVRDVQNRLRISRSDLQGAGGMSRGSSREPREHVRKDMTSGAELSDLDVANLNTGDTGQQRADDRSSSEH